MPTSDPTPHPTSSPDTGSPTRSPTLLTQPPSVFPTTAPTEADGLSDVDGEIGSSTDSDAKADNNAAAKWSATLSTVAIVVGILFVLLLLCAMARLWRKVEGFTIKPVASIENPLYFKNNVDPMLSDQQDVTPEKQGMDRVSTHSSVRRHLNLTYVSGVSAVENGNRAALNQVYDQFGTPAFDDDGHAIETVLGRAPDEGLGGLYRI